MLKKQFLFCFLFGVFLLLGNVGFVHAEESVWSGLVLATNEDSPKDPPVELAFLKSKLKNIFGYNQFQLIGDHTEVINDPDEHWLMPGNLFSLRVDSKSNSTPGYLVRLQLYQEKKMLVETEAKLGRQSPLLIRGPLYGNGQLIIILLVK